MRKKEKVLYQVKIEPYTYKAIEITIFKKIAEVVGVSAFDSKDEVKGSIDSFRCSYFISKYNKDNNLISTEEFQTINSMLLEFKKRHDLERKIFKTKCAICGVPMDLFYESYPNPVCRECEQRAVNINGEKPAFYSSDDYGDNPVFIDGKKCWRRYKFGGFITMLDKYDCKDVSEFYKKNFQVNVKGKE